MRPKTSSNLKNRKLIFSSVVVRSFHLFDLIERFLFVDPTILSLENPHPSMLGSKLTVTSEHEDQIFSMCGGKQIPLTYFFPDSSIRSSAFPSNNYWADIFPPR